MHVAFIYESSAISELLYNIYRSIGAISYTQANLSILRVEDIGPMTWAVHKCSFRGWHAGVDCEILAGITVWNFGITHPVERGEPFWIIVGEETTVNHILSIVFRQCSQFKIGTKGGKAVCRSVRVQEIKRFLLISCQT